MDEERARPLLEVQGLEKHFPAGGSLGKWLGSRKTVHAVTGVSLELREGETYGLVGESGSGKTTTGRALVGLTPPSAGAVRYEGKPTRQMSGAEIKRFRKEVQFVFQDPFSSLNPRKRIGKMLEEPLIIHGIGDKQTRRERVFDILAAVGLQPEHYFRFPHEFSGGQRQRLGLARALITHPKVMICDEPVSALDVSIQSQVLNMLKELQQQMGLTLLFITHDISVVRYISDRIGIMYLGKIVEEAHTDDLFARPLHPYTQALFSAVPGFSRGGLKQRKSLQGEPPSPLSPPSGCVFHTRCPFASGICRSAVPGFKEHAPGHKAACHLISTEEGAIL